MKPLLPVIIIFIIQKQLYEKKKLLLEKNFFKNAKKFKTNISKIKKYKN